MSKDEDTGHGGAIEEPGCEAEEIDEAEDVARDNQDDGHQRINNKCANCSLFSFSPPPPPSLKGLNT